MKLVGIDEHMLRSRRGELQAEIDQIDNILRIAQGTGPRYLGVEVVRETNGGKIHTYHQGNRKQILLGLLAAGGSAYVDTLAQAIGWSVSECAIVARGSIRDGFLSETTAPNQPDKYTLTIQGQSAAQWFRQNPQYKTYRATAVSGAEARRRKQLGE